MLFVICYVVHAAATTIDLLSPLDNFGLRDPQLPPPPGPAKFYSQTAKNAGWGIAQWKIPGGALPPFSVRRQGTTTVFQSRAAESAVTVVHAQSGVVLGLSQDGRYLPCNESGQPRESDLFFAPKKRDAANRNSALTSQGSLLPLAKLQHLYATADVRVDGNPLAAERGCVVNKGAAIISIVLQDPAVYPTQTLFYQLIVYSLCGPQPEKRLQRCRTGGGLGYYHDKNPFGVNDTLAGYEQSLLANGETRDLQIDLLPRLREVIGRAPSEMDPDPAHWSFEGTYAGQIIFGSVSLATSWSAYRLIAITGDQSPLDMRVPDGASEQRR